MKRILALALVLVTVLTFTACEGVGGEIIDEIGDFVGEDAWENSGDWYEQFQ